MSPSSDMEHAVAVRRAMLATDAAILGGAVAAGFIWGWATGLVVAICAIVGAGGVTRLRWPLQEGE